VASDRKSDAEVRALILEAMKYNQHPQRVNTVYMGSMAVAGLYQELGLRYGQQGFNEALEKAPRATLDTMLKKCRPYIEDMQRSRHETLDGLTMKESAAAHTIIEALRPFSARMQGKLIDAAMLLIEC